MHQDTQGSGGVRVALLDAAGKPIRGFGGEECDWINADSNEHTVTWRSRSDLSDITGKPVRLEFTMRNARLFAFQCSRSTQS